MQISTKFFQKPTELRNTQNFFKKFQKYVQKYIYSHKAISVSSKYSQKLGKLRVKTVMPKVTGYHSGLKGPSTYLRTVLRFPKSDVDGQPRWLSFRPPSLLPTIPPPPYAVSSRGLPSKFDIRFSAP